MQTGLAGHSYRLIGTAGEIAAALEDRLTAAGAVPAGPDEAPGILIALAPLIPDETLDLTPLLTRTTATARAMAAAGQGRIVVLLSSAALVPLRQAPLYSQQMAGAASLIRSLAMTQGPALLVNAVAAGMIGTPLVAGDPGMQSHTALPRPGTMTELLAPVLYLVSPMNTYATGQILSVDGGWSAGYARNF